MNEPRRQHLLPQFYLRRFADRRERLTVFPRSGEPGTTEPYTAKITNVLVERDYYTITDESGDESFIVEKAFAELEAVASTALGVLLDAGEVLSDQQRAAWSEFMAVQVTRGRQFRSVFADFTDRVLKGGLRVAAAQAPDEYFERLSANAVARGEEPLPPITPERRQRLMEGRGFTFVPTKEHMIEMSMVALEDLIAIFFQMSWKLVRFGEPCLFTSDHPVRYWREPNSLDRMAGIAPLSAREVRIPLSPSAALILTHPFEVDEIEDAVHEGDVTVARCLNRDLLQWPASKQWLTSPDVQTHPLPSTQSEWLVEWARPWVRSGRYE